MVYQVMRGTSATDVQCVSTHKEERQAQYALDAYIKANQNDLQGVHVWVEEVDQAQEYCECGMMCNK